MMLESGFEEDEPPARASLDAQEAPGADSGHTLLLASTLVGVVLGLVLGYVCSVSPPSEEMFHVIAVPGEVLLRVLRGLVIPLIFCSIVSGVSTIDVSRAGSWKLGVQTILFFLATTLLAAVVGVILVIAIQPGSAGGGVQAGGLAPSAPAQEVASPLESIIKVLYDMFPDNLVGAYRDNNMLGIITFAIVMAVVLVKMGERGKPVLDFFVSMNQAILEIVMMALWLAPFGIMSLIIVKLGGDGSFGAKLEQLGLFIVTVITGLLINTFVIMPVLFLIFARRNPFKYALGLKGAMLFALGTGSSSATLPVTMRESIANNDCDEAAANFVLPLGSVVNMQGSSLYEGIAAVFIAQSIGRELSVANIIIVVLTSALAAIGAGGIPEAGLVTLLIVLSAVGLPLEGVGLLFSVDWFLDRLRTCCNVLGDAFVLGMVDAMEKRRRLKEQ